MTGPQASFSIAEATLDLIRQEQVPQENIIISSFDHDILHIVEQLNPAIEINALLGDNRLLGSLDRYMKSKILSAVGNSMGGCNSVYRTSTLFITVRTLNEQR